MDKLDPAKRAITSALQFFGEVHPYRRMLINRIMDISPDIPFKEIEKALTQMACTGEVVAYEQYDKCLFRLPGQQ